ncbi:MAG: glycosyltransferase family 4 protein [Bacteroidetes bacterium]|nr:glycosyltransferase family 4 protein [Bacteroidota bacterium]
MRVLLSAYSCQPNKGSEPGVGWNWALEISKRGHEVWVLTREKNKPFIENHFRDKPGVSNLNFIYYDLPKPLLTMKKSMGVYIYYQLWQSSIVKLAKQWDQKVNFDIIHHITFGVFRQNTYLYRLRKPLYIGPLGGGEKMPRACIRSLPPNLKLYEFVRSFSNKISLYNPYLIKSFKAAEVIFFKTRESLNSIPEIFKAKSILANEVGCFNNVNDSKLRKHKGNPFEILFVGRLLHWKGAHIAILAFKNLHKLYPESRLFLIGTGPFKETLIKLVTANKLGSAVQILDQLPQKIVFEYYDNAQVFLFPSLHDSSGGVVYEAMSFGLPIVTLNLNGPGFIMGDDYDCSVKVFDKDNQESMVARLAEKLINLYERPEYYNSISMLSILKAKQLTWKNIVEKVYRKIEFNS